MKFYKIYFIDLWFSKTQGFSVKRLLSTSATELPWLSSVKEPGVVRTRNPNHGSKILTNVEVNRLLVNEDNFKEMLNIYSNALRQEGFKHNYVTYKTLISKLGKQKRFKIVDLLLDRMKKENLKCGPGVFIDLIDLYVDSGLIGKSIDLLFKAREFDCDSLEKVFVKLLDVLIQSDHVALAGNLFSDEVLGKLGFYPRIRNYLFLLKFYCKRNYDKSLIEMLELMSTRGISPDVYFYASLIDYFCSVNSCMETVFEILDQMRKTGQEPDLVVYNTIIKGLCKNGFFSRAKEILKEMECRGMNGDCVTYNTLICGICNCNNDEMLDECLNLFYDMLGKKIAPDVITFSILIDCFCRGNMMIESKALLGMMMKFTVARDSVFYHTIIRGFLKKGLVRDVGMILRDFELNVFLLKDVGYKLVLEITRDPCVLGMVLKRGFLCLFNEFTTL